jgi:hypothetical protein
MATRFSSTCNSLLSTVIQAAIDFDSVAIPAVLDVGPAPALATARLNYCQLAQDGSFV